jgi:uncharacterized protein YeeX (DUF496 family)
MKQIAQDVIGELLETGQQAVKQVAGVPKQVAQTAIGKTQTPPTGPSTESTGLKSPTGDPSGDFLATSSPAGDDPLKQLVQQDNQKRVEGIDRVRQELTVLKIKRYNEIQQEIQKVRQQKEEEIPEYVAGQPGAPRTREEQLEQQKKQAKQVKKEQAKDGGAQLPGGPKKGMGALFFAGQHKATSELKKGISG